MSNSCVIQKKVSVLPVRNSDKMSDRLKASHKVKNLAIHAQSNKKRNGFMLLTIMFYREPIPDNTGMNRTKGQAMLVREVLWRMKGCSERKRRWKVC